MMKKLCALLLLSLVTTAKGDIYDTYSDTWVCTDGLGRKVAHAGNGVERTSIDTTVSIGMFYYIWHGQHGEEIKDITKLLKEDADNPKWGKVGQFHWGGEPALGYYEGNDPFVISRHMQMLMDAGVDFYFFDVTNAFTYDGNVKAVMDEVDRRRGLGLKVPKLAFITHSATAKTVQHIYDVFYKDGTNDSYWFKWEGKPLILVELNEFMTLPKEVRETFTARHSWAWESGENKWPWLEFYPQRPGTAAGNDGQVIEQVSVSVSQHPYSKIGKSYHAGKQPPFDKYGLCKETPYGYYFEEQWKQALKLHPKVVMLTQWNEWMAQRFQINNKEELDRVRPGATARIGETYFVDVYNQEFNRDIEPSREPLIRDNYYLQFVSNARKYHGARPIPIPQKCKTIRLNGSFSQWGDVQPEFRDEPGDCHYTSEKAQHPSTFERRTNDIVKAKVAKDKKNLYFYVAANDKIVPSSPAGKTHWMTLLLDTDCGHSTGWNGYDYMVASNQGKMELYHYDDLQGIWKVVKSIRSRCDGKEMMLTIPKKLLQMAADVDFDFKWVDNVPKETVDILDFIVNGDVAPNGRFNYRYRGSQLLSATK